MPMQVDELEIPRAAYIQEHADRAIFRAFAMERVRQDLKWGGATTRGLPLTVWLAVLTEETGEVARAILEHDRANLRQELVQTGAVVTAMLECLDKAAWGVRDEDAG